VAVANHILGDASQSADEEQSASSCLGLAPVANQSRLQASSPIPAASVENGTEVF